ncbi:hypothetical protein EVAR_9202_1 [Eumeta japonica]|uniref:Uncharacterized protein n=1 Tax=Eumeta variegata TaxID=151549 RepID=A0A4C1WN54_EUMVA|nr:hypothetical protein EVAR_9202_1 [Eumeta japonica]
MNLKVIQLIGNLGLRRPAQVNKSSAFPQRVRKWSLHLHRKKGYVATIPLQEDKNGYRRLVHQICSSEMIVELRTDNAKRRIIFTHHDNVSSHIAPQTNYFL